MTKIKDLKVGDVIKISARKKAIYAISEIENNNFKIRKVDKNFEDCGNKTTFKVPFSQMEQIFEKKLGETKKVEKSNPSERLASEIVESNKFFERRAVDLLEEVAYRFSPEVLTADGEIYGNALSQRKAELNHKWKSLEMYFNCTILNDLI